MLLLIFASSCKKDKIETERPKTFADFEKVMAVDEDFNSFIASAIELENLALSKFNIPLILEQNAIPPRVVLNSAQCEELKKVKTFDEMRNFLTSHQIENANKIVDLFERQSAAFFNFVVKYPEYSELSVKEKQLLIGNFLSRHNKLNATLQASGYSSQGRLMVANGSPEQAYGLAIQGCQDSYRTLFRSIWAAADIAMLASSIQTGGIGNIAIFTGAIVATYFADQERGNCMNLAADTLYNEY